MPPPDGPRADTQHPNDPELTRLINQHRDQKNGSTYAALKQYYEARYGPLPANSNIWGGDISQNDSKVGALLEGLRDGIGYYTGAKFLTDGFNLAGGGGSPQTNSTIANPGAPSPTGGNRILDTLRRGNDIYQTARPYIDAFGRIAGGAADQRAEDRGAQAEYDLARVPIHNAQNLQFSNARLDADRRRMREIGSADMLTNLKPPTDPRAKFGNAGGVNPETIAMMRERATKALDSGSDVPELQTVPNQPGGGPTRTDSLLRTLDLVGSGVRTVNDLGGLSGNDGGRSTSVNAPADLEAGIFRQQEQDIPWWSPLGRRAN